MPSNREAKPKFYMDSCLFISILSDEKRANPKEYGGLKDIEFMINQNKAVAIASSLVRVECLFHDNVKAKQQQELFFAFLERPNVDEIGLFPSIAQLAHDVIVECAKDGKRPSHLDAIHLATAIYAEVDVFYTFDGCKNNTKLLALNGHEAVKGMKIEIPKPSLTSLGFID